LRKLKLKSGNTSCSYLTFPSSAQLARNSPSSSREMWGVMYSMTLLALSGFHGRKKMADLLLQEEAGISVKGYRCINVP